MRGHRYDAPAVFLTQLCILLALALLMLCALTARAAEGMSAASVIQRGEARFRDLRDYECMVDVESRLGKRVEAGTCQFWFKQPRMLRVKMRVSF